MLKRDNMKIKKTKTFKSYCYGKEFEIESRDWMRNAQV